jgi:glycosyltransferase involved in cell wall biosynthesis
MTNTLSQNSDTRISVIIPAFNEEQYIGATITALQHHSPDGTEIIVVDNGSTDKTVDISQSLGAKVFSQTEGTIASLRNRGVKESSGDILIFVDADVTVTEAWSKELVNTSIPELIKTPKLVTGSRCLPPDNGKLLNTHWFSLLTEYEAPYINSGHLITSKELFDEIQGFSSHLKTAEDYDFCMKAKACGASLVNNPKLAVYHYGYPETFTGFMARERWHGREDFETWKSFSESKVGIAAAGNLGLAIAALLSTAISLSLLYAIAYILTMAIICSGLTAYKFDTNKIKSFPKTAFIFYLYLTGRSMSLVDRLRSKTSQRSK